jgi:hypothetical protein
MMKFSTGGNDEKNMDKGTRALTLRHSLQSQGIAAGPTARRGVTKRPAPATRMAAVIPQQPPTARANPPQQAAPAPEGKGTRRSFAWWIFLLLILGGAGLYYFNPGIFSTIDLSFLTTASPTPPPATVTLTFTPEPSASPSPAPTETSTQTLPPPTATQTQAAALPLPTATPSPTLTVTATSTLTPTSTPVPEPTVQYPEGQHFTLFYNESSFHLLSQGTLPRTLSGFIFERLDGGGKPLPNVFGGWLWQKEFQDIRGGYCVTIKIYGNRAPYLDPRECKRGYLNIIQIRDDDEQIFWTALENSPQFRVLWKDEEVARCEMEAGICEVYIP